MKKYSLTFLAGMAVMAIMMLGGLALGASAQTTPPSTSPNAGNAAPPASATGADKAGTTSKADCGTKEVSDLEKELNNRAFDALLHLLNMPAEQMKQALGNGQTIASLAASHNVSADTVKAAVIAAIKPVLDGAVTAGKITQAKEDALIASIQAADLDKVFELLNVGGSERQDNGSDFLHSVMDQVLQSAANSLSITLSELFAALDADQSLAQLAASKGVSAQQLREAMATGVKPVLDQAVQAGTITQQQDDATLARIRSFDLSNNPKDILAPLTDTQK